MYEPHTESESDTRRRRRRRREDLDSRCQKIPTRTDTQIHRNIDVSVMYVLDTKVYYTQNMHRIHTHTHTTLSIVRG
jgi:hypothetical protein